ncbi:DUF1828 domain-containing protein [Mesorhizobium sp. M1A.F.Ca.IN.020.06.1.1]|uniref:DUF1828 domain-containing protein n=1 Tax=unclassified Mesorhizobium TaxID=325217 RepID=UPI000FCB011B|nr:MULTISPECIES: DUF1828 domain-containing protein [unclassified Mesorhizobium]RUV02912.1 DUF1828 domain-containing protein [Mesorhizobium sp. M1A.F.Ca.IN.020.03.2.1]RUV86193.1 DUF1828 domain-containing protein [Mesorhizobium sp. M1A.F.Ca.IN.020.32.1.1]RUW10216.1 DUF1828 domain-containing protein [Mesorhizobium sp. M1A.F.Ca.IN.022.05.2.1]RUW30537.1 DUF1828 domain-containing protein [Mesorhizobium sp. M1A.F.Ca.IN.020.06.1.1]RWF76412.1 MAG: DUF1828 domain-containing protein [Mesorhizobium sp.]
MSLAEEICEVVCEGFKVRKVPVGYSVLTPWTWFSGEPLTFFIREEKGQARLEDSGLLVADLQGMGLDLGSENRRALLASLLTEHRAFLDDDDSQFATEWMTIDRVASRIPEFLSFLLRVQDLLFLNRDKVRSTFKEDLASAIQDRFEGEAEIILGQAPIPRLPQYIVDILVAHRDGRNIAIFAGVSDVSVLQAVLFQKELQIKGIDDFKAFLIFEDMNGARVSQRNRSIAINSDLEIGDWGGGRLEVVEKVYRHVH